eukprot:985891-Prymnesium_polylepis.2
MSSHCRIPVWYSRHHWLWPSQHANELKMSCGPQPSSPRKQHCGTRGGRAKVACVFFSRACLQHIGCHAAHRRVRLGILNLEQLVHPPQPRRVGHTDLAQVLRHGAPHLDAQAGRMRAEEVGLVVVVRQQRGHADWGARRRAR